MDSAADQRLPHLFSVGQRHPRLVDGGIVAVLLFIALVPDHPQGQLDLLFDAGLIVPLLWRRQHPFAVFLVIAAVALAQWGSDTRAFGDTALLVALYTVAATQPLRRTLFAAGLLELGIVLAIARWGGDAIIPAFVGLTGLATAAGVLGSNTRHRRALLASLEERAARLERERDAQGRLAASAERSRIAREMHDIVAHNLSVMIALADGASYAVRDTPERAEEAMQTASRTGRQALTEMRRLLGVLRDGTGSQGRAPQPGIAQLDGLVEQVRAAGLPVTYSASGETAALPQGVQLAAYRIVQEALTNTLKHAGPGARAQVSLSSAADHVELEVRDAGGAASPATEDGSGLRGMRERAAVYDGIVDAGPLPGGGWRVWTRLTLTGEPVTALSA